MPHICYKTEPNDFISLTSPYNDTRTVCFLWTSPQSGEVLMAQRRQDSTLMSVLSEHAAHVIESADDRIRKAGCCDCGSYCKISGSVQRRVASPTGKLGFCRSHAWSMASTRSCICFGCGDVTEIMISSARRDVGGGTRTRRRRCRPLCKT